MPVTSFASRLKCLVRQPSLWIALLFWTTLSITALALCRAGVPLNRPTDNMDSPAAQVMESSIDLLVIVLMIGLVAVLARNRAFPDLAQRVPERAVALYETLAMWTYGAIVLLAGRLIGLHYFGEGIGLHLNGCLVGATRAQTPAEVCTWAAYNGILLALIPYIVFRLRGYSREALSLRSANWKNDALIILVVLLIGCAFELGQPNIFQLTRHQQLVGGSLSFVVHLFGTDLPIMIFIYAILLPRYARLVSPAVAYLLGAVSYPAMHVFESWTRYDSLTHAAVSLIFVFLTFFPAGLMKSFLTMRTGNAWVHMWAFHAITPHVMVDTRLVVHDFDIR